jgi:WD40 repeat protein
VQVWSVSSGTTLLTYSQQTSYVEDTAWSPAGDRLASASDDHTVQVWVIAADGTSQKA